MELAPGIRVREEKFGVIIFDKGREKFFVTDEIGKEVLAALKRASSVEEAVEELSQEYEASRGIIRQDIFSFVEELRQAGLIK